MITVSHEPELFTMDDVNVNAPEVPSAADAPPTRSNEQILPRDKWVPVGKSNCFLDVERTQTNPIFKIAVDILKNTNFFRAFTASSTIPSIYIQQFWNTIKFDKDKGYSCQLDEHRFYLTKATLRDALQLPTDNDNFTPPPNGIVNRADIDYAERIWEEFTQCIHSFIKDKMNLTIHAEGKKKVNPLMILGFRFTKLIINHLQRRHRLHKRPGSPLHMPYDEYALGYLKFSFKNTKRVRFGMTILNTLITEDIGTASYYLKYVAKVAKYQRFLAREELRDEFIDEGVPATEPRVDDEEAIVQKVLEERQGQRKGREEQAVQVLLNLQTPKKKNPAEQFIFQMRTPATAEPSGLVESSSLYAELGLTDNGTESEEEVSPEMNAQGQEEGHGGTNPVDVGVSQTPSSHVVHAGPNLDYMDSGIVEASSQPNTEQMDDEFTAIAYPKEIHLKMNQPDHRSVLTDLENQVKMEMEIPRSSGVNSQPHAHT
ncbi:hypothetical protein Tco_1162608 [Tanacetum coccineum]